MYYLVVVILNKLVDEIKTLPILLKKLFEFWKGVSTTQQAHRITTIIKNASRYADIAAAAFLDVSKTFDRVWYMQQIVIL